MENENNPLPIMLRHFRRKKNFTQKQVADMLQISRSSYANYESGRVVPRFDQISKISAILEHDFLFAYTISCQNRFENEVICTDYVYEPDTYVASKMIEEKTTNDVFPFPDHVLIDRELIKMYKILREKGETNERSY